jgi:hypothetical protein
MRVRSQTVHNKIHELYALMAMAAARKAIMKIEIASDVAGAEQWADATARWLDKSSAKQVNWVYSRPTVQR